MLHLWIDNPLPFLWNRQCRRSVTNEVKKHLLQRYLRYLIAQVLENRSIAGQCNLAAKLFLLLRTCNLGTRKAQMRESFVASGKVEHFHLIALA